MTLGVTIIYVNNDPLQQKKTLFRVLPKKPHSDVILFPIKGVGAIHGGPLDGCGGGGGKTVTFGEGNTPLLGWK